MDVSLVRLFVLLLLTCFSLDLFASCLHKNTPGAAAPRGGVGAAAPAAGVLVLIRVKTNHAFKTP